MYYSEIAFQFLTSGLYDIVVAHFSFRDNSRFCALLATSNIGMSLSLTELSPS
jgi:hypothetical protein